MTDAPPAGMIAEFDDPEAMVAALRAARQAGWTRLDAFAPYPVPEAAELLGARGAPIGWIALASGLVGAILAYATQWWLSVHDYPINVGGRPLHALPAFLPATTVVAILWAAVATLVGMLVMNRLPRLHHPVFAAAGFERASQDRFFVGLFAGDPGFDAAEAARFLRRQKPLSVSELPP